MNKVNWREQLILLITFTDQGKREALEKNTQKHLYFV